MKKTRWLLAVVVFGTLTTGAVVAIAHHTGNERRTAADCGGLPPHELQECLRCVSLPRPHHYHPGQRDTHRCDPNDGTR